MKKFTFLILLGLLSFFAQAQVTVVENFDGGLAPPAGWTAVGYFGAVTQVCDGFSQRDNLDATSITGNLTTPNFPGVSNGTDVSVSFDYKVVDWSAAVDATLPGWGEILVNFSTDDGATWQTGLVIDDSNHVTSSTCATMEFTIPAASVAAGSDFKLQFIGNWAAGNFYIYLDNISAVQEISGLPTCSTLITPSPGSTGVTINTDLEWTAANNVPNNYHITVGTTSGGNDILDTDTGLSTVYNLLPTLEYSTTYYINITPSNANGDAEGCEEYSFTTGADPNAPVDCSLGTPVNIQYCYENNDTTTWNFQSLDGSPLNVFFNAGGIEESWDSIIIYDGIDNTAPVLFSGDYGGDLTGLSVNSTGDSIYIEIDSDGVGSCATDSFCCTTPWDFDISCIDTTALPNCNAVMTAPANGETDVNENADITWSPASILVTGYTVNLGTTPGGTDIGIFDTAATTIDPGTLPYETTVYVSIIPYNDNGDANCSGGAGEFSFTTKADPNQIVDCSTNEIINTTYCYGNNENESVNAFYFASSDDSPLFLYFNSGEVENGWDDLVVVDSDGTEYITTGELAGYSFTSSGSTLTVYVISDGVVSCQSSTTITPWDFDVTCVDTSAIPNCNASLTSPVNGAVEVNEEEDIFWSPATVFVTGYYVSIGTTPGGTDIADNVDVGNVLTYEPGTLPYETTIYVTITPYNDNGPATDCIEESFTVKADPNQIVDCGAGEIINTTYCYGNNENESVNAFYFTSSDDSPLFLYFNSGEVEDGWDDLVVVDSDGTEYVTTGELAGYSFTSSGNTLAVYVISDGVVSCQSSTTITPWDFDVTCVDTSVQPNCNAVLTSPSDGEIDVEPDQVLSWSQATVFVTGYYLSIGTSPGATDVLDNFDVGDVLTYNPGTLEYATTYYVSIVPYNDNGPASDNPNTSCTEYSFTVKDDPNVIIDCESAEMVNTVYCYGNNENESVNAFYFSNTTGYPLVISFNAGQVENNWDELYIVDGDGTVLNADFPYGNAGDLTGLTYTSNTSSIVVYVESDGVFGCQSNGYTPWDFDVWCLTCIPQTVDFQVVDDCDNGEQFLVDVNVTDFGDATSITLSNNIDTETIQVTETGTYQMGPFPFMTDVVITSVNDDDANCTVSSTLYQLGCPPENDDCANATVVPVNEDSSCDLFESGTILGASASNVPAPSCGGTPNDDVWFEFVANNADLIIELSNIEGDFTNLDFVVYEGTCGTLTEVLCSTDISNVINGLTVDNTYYIRVFSSGGDDYITTFDICIKLAPAPVIGDTTTYTVPELVTDVLVNSPCANISNITWSTGVTTDPSLPNGIGYFYSTGEGFPFEDGVVLVSGDASDITGPNDSTLSNGSWAGDNDLFDYINGLGIDPGLTDYNDATVLEFDFVPYSDTLNFDFLFASDEYGTFQCSYSDAFAFFLTDTSTGTTTNLALVPDTTDPISVITIRDDAHNGGCPSVNPEYFDVYYGDTGLTPIAAPINFNGQTVPMTATSTVVPYNTYHIKLVIADRNDNSFDSAVFLRGGSFNLASPTLGDSYLVADGTALCDGSEIVLDSGLDATEYEHVWYLNDNIISGETGQNITVTEAGVYGVEVFYGVECSTYDDIEIEFFANPTTNDAPTILACNDGGSGTFDLTENEAAILGTQDPTEFTLTYFPSEQDAIDGTNGITDASAYTNTSSPETIYVVVTNNVTGCSSITSFEIVLDVLPSLSITEEPLSEFCPGSVLTAVSDDAVSYMWSTNAETQTIVVDSNGIYGVTVTNESGCSNYIEYEVTSISSGSFLSDYTIIAKNRAYLHGNNTVLSGGVGVTGNNGQIKLHQNSHIVGFGEANSFALQQGSTIGEQIDGAADITLPPFIYNTQSNSDSPSVTIYEGQSMTLDGSVYDLIDIRPGASVTFTQSNVYVNRIKTLEYAVIDFEGCTNLYINDLFILAKNSVLNPLGQRVSIYVNNNVHVEKNCKVEALIYVNGNNTILAKGANINTPEADATFMKGLFIAHRIEGDQNVYWEAGDICEPCPVDDFAMDRVANFDVVSYPNPSNTKFNLKLRTDDFFTDASISVYDLSGKLVHTATLKPGEELSFGSELEGGIYLVKVNQGKNNKVVRLIKH